MNDVDDFLGSDDISNYYIANASFENFVVPEDADLCQVQVSWAEADKFADGEASDEDLIAIGVIPVIR